MKLRRLRGVPVLQIRIPVMEAGSGFASKSRIWTRIRTKIMRTRNTGYIPSKSAKPFPDSANKMFFFLIICITIFFLQRP
jgi:hypothetical protein